MNLINEFDNLFAEIYTENYHLRSELASNLLTSRFNKKSKYYVYPKNLFIDVFGNLIAYTDMRACALIEYLKSRYSQRDFDIIEMWYKNNVTYAKIGQYFNISGERVRQILKAFNTVYCRVSRSTNYVLNNSLHIGYVIIDSSTESDIKTILIDNLNISIDGYRKLYTMRIYTIQDLIQFTSDELMCYLKISFEDIRIISNYLSHIGLSLRQPMVM